MERPEYERMYALEDKHWWFVGRRHLALALLDTVQLRSDARILDVGCGTGGNFQALIPFGKTYGLDISPIALELAQHRDSTHLLQGSSLTLPHPNNTFDLVTVFDVLYHRWIVNDERALNELFRVIRPTGWLLITDSALPFLWSSHDQTYYARQRYTLNLLRQKLGKTGFELKICSYVNLFLLPFMLFVRLTMDRLQLFKDAERQGMFPNWLNRLLIWVRDLEAAWLKQGGSFPIGSSVVCLSQKPTE